MTVTGENNPTLNYAYNSETTIERENFKDRLGTLPPLEIPINQGFASQGFEFNVRSIIKVNLDLDATWVGSKTLTTTLKFTPYFEITSNR